MLYGNKTGHFLIFLLLFSHFYVKCLNLNEISEDKSKKVLKGKCRIVDRGPHFFVTQCLQTKTLFNENFQYFHTSH